MATLRTWTASLVTSKKLRERMRWSRQMDRPGRTASRWHTCVVYKRLIPRQLARVMCSPDSQIVVYLPNTHHCTSPEQSQRASVKHTMNTEFSRTRSDHRSSQGHSHQISVHLPHSNQIIIHLPHRNSTEPLPGSRRPLHFSRSGHCTSLAKS